MSTTFRRASYYSRVLVPKDLHAILGRQEILRSLHTASYRVASIRGKLCEAKLASLFQTLRRQRDMLTQEELQAIVRRYLEQSLEDAEQDRLMRPRRELGEAYADEDGTEYEGLTITGLEEEESRFAEALFCNDFSIVEPIVDKLLTDGGTTIDKSFPAYKRLCRDILKASIKAARINLQRERQWGTQREREWSTERESATVGASVEATSGPSGHRETPIIPTTTTMNGNGRTAVHHLPVAEGGLLFSQAVQAYFAHYNDRDQRTKREKQRVLQRFIEIVSGGGGAVGASGDRPLQTIAKADLIKFRDTLSRFPRRTPEKYRGKPVGVLLDYLDRYQGEYERLSRASVNADLTDLQHFFRWAIKHDYYAGNNPVEGIAYEGVKQESYEAFTDADLSLLLNNPRFTKERTGRQRERYWLPLILMYSGARREEIAQLVVSDVRQDEGGIWYFDITPDAERETRVKNEASKRRTPVHSALIALGLLQYVEEITKKHGNKSLLFPLPAKTKGRKTVGDAVGKWYRILSDKSGVKGRKPLHSFRHTVVTRLIGAGVPQDKVQMIVGHTDSTITGGIYTDRQKIPLTLLKQCLEGLDYGEVLKSVCRP